MWSPDRDLLKETVSMLETLDEKNKCNSLEEVELHVRTKELIDRVNKHLMHMGILR